jgi:hypothetical protein
MKPLIATATADGGRVDVDRLVELLLSDDQYLQYLKRRIRLLIPQQPNTDGSDFSADSRDTKELILQRVVDEVVDKSFTTFGIQELLKSLEHQSVMPAAAKVNGTNNSGPVVDSSQYDSQVNARDSQSSAVVALSPSTGDSEFNCSTLADNGGDDELICLTPKFSASEPVVAIDPMDALVANGKRTRKQGRSLLTQRQGGPEPKTVTVDSRSAGDRSAHSGTSFGIDFSRTRTLEFDPRNAVIEDIAVEEDEAEGTNGPHTNGNVTADDRDLNITMESMSASMMTDSDAETVDRGRPLGLDESMESLEELHTMASLHDDARLPVDSNTASGAIAGSISTNRGRYAQDNEGNMENEERNANSIKYTKDQTSINSRQTRYEPIDAQDSADDGVVMDSLELERRHPSENTCLPSGEHSVTEDTAELYVVGKPSSARSTTYEHKNAEGMDKSHHQQHEDEPELLVTGWPQLYHKNTRVNNRGHKQVRFLDEEPVANYLQNGGIVESNGAYGSLVTDVVLMPKYSPFEVKLMFYSHAESTRFHTDYDIEVSRAESEGLTWLEWMNRRTDKDIAEEEEALREVMAMNEEMLARELELEVTGDERRQE